MTWRWRIIFKKECSSLLLKQHIKSPTAKKAARIIKHLVWAGVLLGATIGCLITITDRIKYLNSHPTATTISIIERHVVKFPAVTVCNLNIFRREELQKRNLTNLIHAAARQVREENAESCERGLQTSSSQSDINLTSIKFEELTLKASDNVKKLIRRCYFAGEPCGNLTEVFQPISTELGICYTFNSGRVRPLVRSKGSGQREGLRLVITVNQSDYATSLDAGVKVAIHNQSEPPLPGDKGIGIPTGRSAFISIKEQDIQNNAGLHCRPNNDISTFHFLGGEYHEYSESACLVNCAHTSIAKECECLSARSFYRPDSFRFSRLPDCRLEKICCILDALTSPSDCPCPVACKSILFEATVSYSYYPAKYMSQILARSFNTTPTEFFSNSLEVNVYFETLNIETQTTDEAYSFVALLSDIGGQVGLFLGLSVISVLQFGDWIIKIIRGHNLSADVKRVKEKYCPCRRHSVMLDNETSVLVSVESESTETSPA